MTEPIDPESQPPSDEGGGFWSGLPPWFLAIGGVLLGAIVALLVVLAVSDDDSVETVTDTTTTTEAPTSTSEEESTTTTAEEGTTTIEETTTTTEATTTTSEETTTTTDPAEVASAVWPWVGSSTRFTDPVEAARSFAVDLVGFTDPVVGSFQQGDSRSGEVEIRPAADGPVTVVFVRQLGSDDTWWILGSVTENIVVDQPASLATIDDPVTVSGRALAFEGTVDVAIVADGETTPLVETFVTGGGTELAPFMEDISWPNPGTGVGSMLFFTRSAENGQVWEASVVRVSFAP